MILATDRLTNHLGSLLQVVSDRKLPVNDGNGNIDYFLADVVSYSDYYPYGMQMLGRNGSTGEYRYGFQGQEKDDEVKGEGNSINYKYRMHDPRVGRFFMVDPLADKYPFYSPYAFSGNRVLDAVELEGLEPSSIHVYFTNNDGDITSEFHKTEQGTGHLGDYFIEGVLPSIGVKSKDFSLNSNVTIIYNVDSKEVENTFESKVKHDVAKRKETPKPEEKRGALSVGGEGPIVGAYRLISGDDEGADAMESSIRDYDASWDGIQGARKFADGATFVGGGLSMFGIPGGAVIEGFGLSYSSYLDFHEGNENAGYNTVVRGLTFGVGIGLGRSIDKTGADQGVKQLQKAGVGVATGEISEEAIELEK